MPTLGHKMRFLDFRHFREVFPEIPKKKKKNSYTRDKKNCWLEIDKG